MRLALSCLLSLLLLASALWSGEDGRWATAEPARGTVAQALAGVCERWDELGGQSDELERRVSAESPTLNLDDSAEMCWTPAPAVAVSAPEFPHLQRAPAIRYVGPWLRVPQRPPSTLA